MTSIRSSVRPSTTKLPWGTILKPEFGLGYQKMTEYEIDQTVNRLYYVPQPKERQYPKHGKSLNQEEIEEMLKRLARLKKGQVTDSDRRVSSSTYRNMGVVNSFAWKGYN